VDTQAATAAAVPITNLGTAATLVTNAALAFKQQATETRLAQRVNYVTPSETAITANLQAALAAKRVKTLQKGTNQKVLVKTPGPNPKLSIHVQLGVVQTNKGHTIKTVSSLIHIRLMQ